MIIYKIYKKDKRGLTTKCELIKLARGEYTNESVKGNPSEDNVTVLPYIGERLRNKCQTPLMSQLPLLILPLQSARIAPYLLEGVTVTDSAIQINYYSYLPKQTSPSHDFSAYITKCR